MLQNVRLLDGARHGTLARNRQPITGLRSGASVTAKSRCLPRTHIPRVIERESTRPFFGGLERLLLAYGVMMMMIHFQRKRVNSHHKQWAIFSGACRHHAWKPHKACLWDIMAGRSRPRRHSEYSLAHESISSAHGACTDVARSASTGSTASVLRARCTFTTRHIFVLAWLAPQEKKAQKPLTFPVSSSLSCLICPELPFPWTCPHPLCISIDAHHKEHIPKRKLANRLPVRVEEGKLQNPKNAETRLDHDFRANGLLIQPIVFYKVPD